MYIFKMMRNRTGSQLGDLEVALSERYEETALLPLCSQGLTGAFVATADRRRHTYTEQVGDGVPEDDDDAVEAEQGGETADGGDVHRAPLEQRLLSDGVQGVLVVLGRQAGEQQHVVASLHPACRAGDDSHGTVYLHSRHSINQSIHR